MLQKRTNILFEKEMWDRLVALAKKEGTSVGDLTRKAVEKVYLQDAIVEDRRKAIEKTLELRKQIKGTFTAKEIKEMINYGRKY